MNGKLVVITGSMFSGKSTELVRHIRQAKLLKKSIAIFKPQVDNRYSNNEIATHDQLKEECHIISSDNPKMIQYLTQKNKVDIVFIDEIQFFNKLIVDVLRDILRKGADVYCAGLKADFRHEPFGSMGEILCIADDIIMLHAVCLLSGDQASRTQRITNGTPSSIDEDTIVVGAEERYEARSYKTHEVPGSWWINNQAEGSTIIYDIDKSKTKG